MSIKTRGSIVSKTCLLAHIHKQLGMRVAPKNPVIQQRSCISLISVSNRSAESQIQFALIYIETLLHYADFTLCYITMFRIIFRRYRSI
ncbi:hypothetical protein D3C73_991290 [compost metagenome]